MRNGTKSFITAAALLPERLWRCAFKLSEEERASAEEFRLRKNKPMSVICGSKGVLTRCTVFSEDISETISRCTASSFHTFSEQIKRGYITAPGGHRVGLCGVGLTDSGVGDVSSINIRIAKESFGVAFDICSRIRSMGLGNILVVSPPGAGKTTFLRDLAKELSKDHTVAVADERCELFPIFASEQVFDPFYCDVLSAVPRSRAMGMLLSSMTPQLIVCDEILGEEDKNAVLSVIGTGCHVAVSAHGKNYEDALKRRDINELSDVFKYVIEISAKDGKRFYRMLKTEEEDEAFGSVIDDRCVL